MSESVQRRARVQRVRLMEAVLFTGIPVLCFLELRLKSCRGWSVTENRLADPMSFWERELRF